MPSPARPPLTVATALVVALTAATSAGVVGQQEGQTERFRFRTGVELINVTATVTDTRGRFVPGLTKADFLLYEDDRPQPITHFNADRVPVSLGLVIDASGSMEGDKWRSALGALDRFLFDLLDPADEIFLYKFNASPELVEGWTHDPGRISRALDRISPNGGTALLDAVAEAVPLAQTGRNQKKAVVVISDGNDTGSHINTSELRALIRETEVLVYAIAIDGSAPRTPTRSRPTPPIFRPPLPLPLPFPLPGGGRAPGRLPPGQPRVPSSRGADTSVDMRTLRDITDDSGGRTELVRSARDLDPATADIADELSRQYYLGYSGAASRCSRCCPRRSRPCRRRRSSARCWPASCCSSSSRSSSSGGIATPKRAPRIRRPLHSSCSATRFTTSWTAPSSARRS